MDVYQKSCDDRYADDCLGDFPGAYPSRQAMLDRLHGAGWAITGRREKTRTSCPRCVTERKRVTIDDMCISIIAASGKGSKLQAKLLDGAWTYTVAGVAGTSATAVDKDRQKAVRKLLVAITEDSVSDNARMATGHSVK